MPLLLGIILVIVILGLVGGFASLHFLFWIAGVILVAYLLYILISGRGRTRL